MNRSTGRHDGGGIILALVLLVVGGYYFLRNTLGFDLGELDGEALWPLVVLAIGASILYRNLFGRPDSRSDS